MSARKRLHPERVVLIFGLVTGVLMLAFGLTGFLTESNRLMAWAGYALVINVVVMSTPMLFFVIGLAIEKFRGNRHD